MSSFELWSVDLEPVTTHVVLVTPGATAGLWRATPCVPANGDEYAEGKEPRLAAVALAASLGWPLVFVRPPGDPSVAESYWTLRSRLAEATEKSERILREATHFYQVNAEVGLALTRALVEGHQTRAALAGSQGLPDPDAVATKKHWEGGGFWLVVSPNGERRLLATLTALRGFKASGAVRTVWFNSECVPVPPPAAPTAAPPGAEDEEESDP